MNENPLGNGTQHQGFNINIKVDFNNGTAATALFVVLGLCCCMYINAKYHYITTINYKNNSLSIGPATMAVQA